MRSDNRVFTVGSILLTALVAATLDASDLRVVNLRCEYQADPPAVDVPSPRLSWQITSDARSVKQTACRILVSSDKMNKGDLWDSGKIEGDQSINIHYAGNPLRSFQKCFWKVQVWAGDAMAKSKTAQWTMGVLSPNAWKAEWIAAGKPPKLLMNKTQWVWTEEPHDGLLYPPSTRYFRWHVTLPERCSVKDADVVMTADNSFVLYVNGHWAGGGDSWKVLNRIDVARYLRCGDNVLSVTVTNGGTRPNEAGVLARLDAELSDGSQVVFRLDATALTSKEKHAGWRKPSFDDSAWKPACVLGRFGMQPWGKPVLSGRALPLFRREFVVDKKIERAIAYVCGLGFHELNLNGAKVGAYELAPGWTNYRKACIYSAYDVTAHLRRGRNALGVMLGNGMYNVTGGRYVKFLGSFGGLKLLLQLRIEYADGTTEEVATDRSWRTHPGPIVFSCIFGGEDYDARCEIDGWDRPGSDDAAWRQVQCVEGPGGRLTSRSAPPITVRETFRPVKITEPRPGVFVYDLGQNFSGWPKLSVTGPAGSTVKLVPGELLDANGLVTQRSSGRPVWFSYTLKGSGKEVWRPRFSYYGFRYLQVEGAVPQSKTQADSTLPRIQNLEGEFLYPATHTAGRFSCSNAKVNQVHELILAAIKSNFKSVLTDCPHREKLGWLECSHLLAGCFMYNYDCARFYQKITRDMRQAQLENGLVPDIAPEYTVFNGGFRDSPEWGSAIAIAPWRTYLMYGDKEILIANYKNMKRYVAYLSSRAQDHIVSHGLGDWCDVGPGAPGVSKLTSLGLTSTCVYYQDVDILRRIAHLLGKTGDVKIYTDLAEKIKDSFNRKFFHAEKNRYDRNSQTANAMPLFLDLVPPEHREAVLQNLVKDIRANGNRVTAGDVGFYYLVQALLRGGRSDVLYDMLCRDDGPGYLYQLRKGATSLIETWDANPATSQNHCMLGHIEEWFYSGLLGIRLKEPGFRKCSIRPFMPTELTRAEGRYDTGYGRIRSSWKRSGGTVTMEVTIPANTTATVFVPAESAAKVTESGKPVDQAKGVSFQRMEKGCAVFEVGSGSYLFTSS